MDLSLVVTCKNREKNLRFCLKSISLQTQVPNVIVVDFGSTISLSSLRDEYPWVKVINAMNNTDMFHKSRALNIGIKQVETNYICMIDADQIYSPKFFERAYGVLKNKKVFILSKTYSLQNLPEDTTVDHLEDRYLELFKIAKNSKLYGQGACFGINTKWLKTVRGYDEKYIGWGAQVNDIVIRARACGFLPINLNKFNNIFTIHLPHEKKDSYYSNAYKIANKRRFKSRKKVLKNKKQITIKDVIVNTNIWGMI